MELYDKKSPLRRLIIAEFNQKKYKPFHDWYTGNFTRQQVEYHEKSYFKDMYDMVIKTNQEYPYKVKRYIDWFLTKYCSQQQVSIQMLEREWKTEKGKSSQSYYPPSGSLIIEGEETNLEISSYGKLSTSDNAVTLKDLNILLKQNNFANLNLVLIGKHLIQLEEKIDLLLKQKASAQSTTSMSLRSNDYQSKLIDGGDLRLRKLNIIIVRVPYYQ